MPCLAVTWVSISYLFVTPERDILVDYRVQNVLYPSVCKLHKFIHVKPFLNKLQWLPILYRILFNEFSWGFLSLPTLYRSYHEAQWEWQGRPEHTVGQCSVL